MPYTLYTKPFQNENQLIALLTSKNLIFNDVPLAKNIFKNINYYRFKIYLHPFKDPTTKLFDGITTFEDALSLYRFDDQLRDIFFSIIGRIEIKLRSKLNNTITNFSNNPFWYLDNQYFQKDHKYILEKTSMSFLNSKEDFIDHFQSSYVNDTNSSFKHLPPFWMACEILTFGDLLKIYKSLNKNKFNYSPHRNILDDLAKSFGAYNLSNLNQWMEYIKIVRNKCAHHSRVWNANYFAIGGLNYHLSPHYLPSNQNRIYSFFVILKIICSTLALDIDIKKIIQDLMTQYPQFSTMKNSAGFPHNWNLDPFWK